MITRLVGERFKFNNQIFYAVPVNNDLCISCYFYYADKCPNWKPNDVFGSCDRKHRNDCQDIIWKCQPIINIF